VEYALAMCGGVTMHIVLYVTGSKEPGLTASKHALSSNGCIACRR